MIDMCLILTRTTDTEHIPARHTTNTTLAKLKALVTSCLDLESTILSGTALAPTAGSVQEVVVEVLRLPRQLGE